MSSIPRCLWDHRQPGRHLDHPTFWCISRSMFAVSCVGEKSIHHGLRGYSLVLTSSHMASHSQLLAILRRVALLAPCAVGLSEPSPAAAQQLAPRHTGEPQLVTCPARKPTANTRCRPTTDPEGESVCQYGRNVCGCYGTARRALWQCEYQAYHPNRGPLPPPELQNA